MAGWYFAPHAGTAWRSVIVRSRSGLSLPMRFSRAAPSRGGEITALLDAQGAGAQDPDASCEALVGVHNGRRYPFHLRTCGPPQLELRRAASFLASRSVGLLMTALG